MPIEASLWSVYIGPLLRSGLPISGVRLPIYVRLAFDLATRSKLSGHVPITVRIASFGTTTLPARRNASQRVSVAGQSRLLRADILSPSFSRSIGRTPSATATACRLSRVRFAEPLSMSLIWAWRRSASSPSFSWLNPRISRSRRTFFASTRRPACGSVQSIRTVKPIRRLAGYPFYRIVHRMTRGLFRLWVVLSAIWVAASGGLLYVIPGPSKPKECLTANSLAECSEMIHRAGRTSNLDARDTPLKVDDAILDALSGRVTYVDKRAFDTPPYVGIAGFLLLPPAILLAFGVTFIWVVRGFATALR
jgi:hypothetical protein